MEVIRKYKKFPSREIYRYIEKVPADEDGKIDSIVDRLEVEAVKPA